MAFERSSSHFIAFCDILKMKRVMCPLRKPQNIRYAYSGTVYINLNQQWKKDTRGVVMSFKPSIKT